eukprot:Gregarina_sp_Poly_1__3756@NODE_2112_length_2667_cov_91_117692_g1362_i0_p2_GENE_NODE_2112_length_2667_cov_91_117692_g1362_i0NODE_2112_length_2667_cov_91_117692_g1362_i0_p2_ORF_typecomplete_len273_score13_00zfLITAFlike/PF10601_9/4_3e11zfLITAFlike/PF10601_9/1_7e04tRNA_antilike/PF12869_7/0_17_NODE_2112_length_2667_cov_91_117692_g1362_i084902
MSFGIEREVAPESSPGLDPAAVASTGKEGKHYGEYPVHCVCPWCARSIVTHVEHQSTWMSLVLFLVLFLLLHVFAFCLYPFLSGFTQQIIHTCPRCSGELHRCKRFEFPTISHQIITLRCGNCAVIISRKYALGALCCVLLVCGASTLRWYVKTFGLPDVEEGPPISASWQDYVRDCGTRSSLGNPLHAQAKFQQDYFGKTIAWEGRLLEVKEGYFRKNFLLIIMDPHQYNSVTVADLAMVYNGIKYDHVVAELEVGDKLAFNATLLELGRR